MLIETSGWYRAGEGILMALELPLFDLYRPAAAGTPDPWLLVLLHGIGSNEEDLFGLSGQVPDHFHVASLRAPIAFGPGSYAWFAFDVLPSGRRVIDQAQEAHGRQLLVEATQAASARLAVPPERVIVGGFSQGGIMALSLLLTRPELLQAAMVLHSRLLPEVLPLVAPASALNGRQLWVSHGTADAVIPLASAHDIRDRVQGWPIELSYAEFPGGHEIRPAELEAALAWLATVSAAKT